MDKLSYHFNKKKLPGKTPGTYLYHYPCAPADRPNFYMGGKAYAVIEVTEREWQALRELDRLEYNNTHRYLRHTTPIRYNVDEDALTPEQQEKRLDKSEPFTDLIHDRLDEERALAALSKKQRHIVYLYKRKDMTQAEIAEQLGVTQGYVSSVLQKAEDVILRYHGGDDRDLIAWQYWEQFVKKGEMPQYTDVLLEFVLRALLHDLTHILPWFYSLGELMRFLLKSYLFDNDKITEEIKSYLASAEDEERAHFEEYYGEQPELVGGIYVRLRQEVTRRKEARLHDSDKLYDGIASAVKKIADRLHMTAEEYIKQRFYPFLAAWRNKRITAFRKHFAKKYKFFSGRGNISRLPVACK